MDHSEIQRRLATDRALANEERAKVVEEHAKVESGRARAAEDQVKVAKAWAKDVESRAAQVVEYKDSDAFETDIVAIAIKAYNLGFDDCKRKVAEAFSIFDLYQITPMGEPEDDEEDEGEKNLHKSSVEMMPVKRSSKSLHLRSLRQWRLQLGFHWY